MHIALSCSWEKRSDGNVAVDVHTVLTEVLKKSLARNMVEKNIIPEVAGSARGFTVPDPSISPSSDPSSLQKNNTNFTLSQKRDSLC